MNKKQIIISCLVFYLILREFTMVDYSFFRSFAESNSSLEASFTDKSYAYNNELYEFPLINFNENDNYIFHFYGLDEIKIQDEKVNVVNVSVSYYADIDPIRYLPLIKPIEFSSSNTYNWYTDIYIGNKIHNISGSGFIDIYGEMKIYGICSGKTAKKKIDKLISNKIKSTIINSINGNLKKLKPHANNINN